jgi:hypothetical protein
MRLSLLIRTSDCVSWTQRIENNKSVMDLLFAVQYFSCAHLKGEGSTVTCLIRFGIPNATSKGAYNN